MLDMLDWSLGQSRVSALNEHSDNCPCVGESRHDASEAPAALCGDLFFPADLSDMFDMFRLPFEHV